MNKDDLIALGILSLLALFIWLRDFNWITSLPDTLPILACFPIFIFLGAPWRWKYETTQVSPSFLQSSTIVVIFLAGIAVDLTILLTLAWTLLLWSWLSMRLETPSRQQLLKLLVFPMMAFPWISLDGQPIGWLFRLSGAWVVANIYSLLGLNALQQGTKIVVNNFPISIDVACAGLNTLQSMLIAGSALAYLYLGGKNRYWFNIALLPLLAWVANTMRVFILTAAVLLAGPEFALGIFHTWGGWLVIVLMFTLSWLIFSCQNQHQTRGEKT